MKILEKIIWAVDSNQDPELSVSKLKIIAEQFGNELIILNVLPEELRKSSYFDVVKKSTETELKNLVDEFSSEDNLKVSYEIAIGSIADSIIEVSEKHNAAAILINTGVAQKDNVGNIGQNAFKVLQNSHKPVVILSNEHIKEKWQIVCPVDFSEPSTQALNDAILHAKKGNYKLKVISIYKPLKLTSPRLFNMGIEVEDENKKLYEQYLSEFNEFLKDINFLNIEYKTECIEGDPVTKIIEEAKKANVLYMGSNGRSGLKRVIMGSVTEKVVQAVPCNIVVTKSENIFTIKTPANIKDIKNHFAYGLKLMELGYDEKAISHFKECLNINGMHLPSVIELLKVYKKLERANMVTYYENLYNNIKEQYNNWKIEAEIRKGNSYKR